MAASWTFVLTDTSYRHLGEVLNADERQVVLPLDKLPQAKFKVRRDNPLSSVLMTNACYLKAYRQSSATAAKSLEFFGPVVSAQEAGDSASTISVNASGVGWILTKRLAGKSATGQQFSSLTDRAQIVKTVIDATNVENETGIATTGSISAASAITYTAGPYKPISEVINDLSLSFDGFDWRIDPVENFSGGKVTGQKIGNFVAAPVFGTTVYDALYEWGTGRANVANYNFTVSRDTQANQVYHNASQGPDAPGYPTVVTKDADAIANWRLMEDVADADISDLALRQSLTDEHVRVRKNPRSIIAITPHIDDGSGRLPLYRSQFIVGDRVRARVVYHGETSFDGLVRVWGITFDISKLGTEQQTLALADE